MPNWAECELRVTGPSSDLQRFVGGLTRKADDPTLVQILESYAPVPAPLRAVSSGSESLGYDILYTDDWVRIALYPWVRDVNGGQPPTTREDTWLAYVANRVATGGVGPAGAYVVTESALRATADRYKQNAEDYGHTDWYDWACEEWGSKWGDCNTRITRVSARQVTFAFESPWAPPTRGLHKVAGLFPTLTFDLRYWEGGMGFQGHALWQRGDCVAAEHTDYAGPRGG